VTEHLWAPWRIEYITAGGDKAGGCFLCRDWANPQDDEKNLVLARGEQCFAVLNRYPYNGGHLMIAPRHHVARLNDVPEEAMVEMLRLARVAERVLTAEMKPHGFNVGFNVGRPAGAGVADHLHLHVVPRWEGDTNFMPVLDDTRVVPVALEKVWQQLAPRFAETL
jgi:ATP adenylyltransferase